jgi:hypothetical protein
LWRYFNGDPQKGYGDHKNRSGGGGRDTLIEGLMEFADINLDLPVSLQYLMYTYVNDLFKAQP